MTNEV